MRSPRDEFFGNEKIKRLTNHINKRTLCGFNYLLIKDKDVIKYLKVNVDWLDYVGIVIEENKIKKTFIIRWEGNEK